VKLQIEYSLDLLGAFGEGRFQVSILKNIVIEVHAMNPSVAFAENQELKDKK